MILRGFKLSDIDSENLYQYRKYKLQFQMKNTQKTSTFEILIHQLQKNIMNNSPVNLEPNKTIKLEDEVLNEKRRIIKEKIWTKKLLPAFLSDNKCTRDWQ